MWREGLEVVVRFPRHTKRDVWAGFLEYFPRLPGPGTSFLRRNHFHLQIAAFLGNHDVRPDRYCTPNILDTEH